ncbi:MAG: DUF934 domain-containing protein [Alphaproteobacteria bacterium]
MPIIKHSQVIDDPWTTIGVKDALPPAHIPLIVPLARWQADRAALIARHSPLGLRLAGDQSPETVADDLTYFEVFALEFAAFTDGRAYSYARLLRERYGYSGEIRAVGNVLRDQLIFMRRCGFDAFEIDTTRPKALAQFQAALSEIDVWYQAGADTETPVYARRQHMSDVFLNGTAG